MSGAKEQIGGEGDVLSAQPKGLEFVGLPHWAAWIVAEAPVLDTLVFCGDGASAVAAAVLEQGGVTDAHVVETGSVLATQLFAGAGKASYIDQAGVKYWRSPLGLLKHFRAESQRTNLGLVLLPGTGGSLEKLLQQFAGEVQWMGMAVNLTSSASAETAVAPSRLLALLSSLKPANHRRFDSLNCMIFTKEDRPAEDGAAPAYLVAQALLAATDRRAKKQLAEKDSELKRARAELKSAIRKGESDKRQLEQLTGSVAYRLARSVVDAIYSPRQLLRLPSEVVVQGRHYLEQRRTRAVHAAAALNAPAKKAGDAKRTAPAFDEARKAALKTQVTVAIPDGVDAIVSIALQFVGAGASASVRALALLVAAQACSAENRHDLEFQLAEKALSTHRSVGVLRGYLHAALRSRQMDAADAALRELIEMSRKGVSAATEFLERFKTSSTYKLAALAEIPSRPKQWSWPRSRKIAYVLHNSLPYSSGGYATRSHGVAAGLLATGMDVTCITRPGFPRDIKPELEGVKLPLHDVVDQVSYVRLQNPSRAGISEYEYIMKSVPKLEAALAKAGAGYVQAASNYVTGLPALIAARRLGIPFFYEVRGLWEITRMSREPEFEASAAFAVQRQIESVLAREADHVFTLTEPMREELILRGVEPERITLLPNSVDADKFLPMGRDAALADRLGIPPGVPVIGYIGTFVAYEGLEDLASACVKLHQSGQDFRLMLIGNENASGQGRGPISEEIIRISTEGGILDKVIMPGRIPHEDVASYYSLVDISPFPRKPWPVCEMVSPMKPLEALAMEKAVLVSSVRALTEMIQDGVTGRVFEKGSVESLFQVMREMIADPESRTAFGLAGRRWVQRDRSWQQVASRIGEQLAAADGTGPRTDLVKRLDAA